MKLTSILIAIFVATLCPTLYSRAAEAEIPRAVKPDPRAAITAERLKRYDRNKNGKLDADEIEMIGRDEMLKNDRNKDGRVDQYELKHPVTPTTMLPPMHEVQRAMALEHVREAWRVQAANQKRSRTETAPSKATSAKDSSPSAR